MTFPLQVPRFWTRALFVRLGFYALLASLVADRLLGEAFWVFAALTAPTLVWRALRLSRLAPVIEIGDDALILPVSHERNARHRVPFAALLAVAVQQGRRAEALIIHTRARTYMYPSDAFLSPTAVHTFLDELRRRVVASPEGEDLRRAFVEREAMTRILARRRVWVTPIIVGVLGIVYAIELSWKTHQDPLGLVPLGANSPVLVRAGQWWRLFASSVLHQYLPWHLHFTLNAISLYSLGSLLERLLGHAGFWLVYAASAVMGGVISAGLGRGVVAVGASGAVFGLLGSLLTVQLRYRATMPAGVRQSQRWWITIAVINVGLPIAMPQIDWAAHAGGFAAGALVTLVLAAEARFEELGARAQPITVLLSTAALIFAGASLYITGVRARDASAVAADEIRVIESAVERDDISPYVLNDIAWSVAIRPQPSDEALAAAERAADRAVTMLEAEDDIGARPNVLDTLATVLFRRGAVAKAAELERTALAEGERPSFALTVAKFVAALPKPESPPTLTKSGRRLSFESETPLAECTTIVARSGQAALVAYVPKDASGRLLLDLVVGGNAGESPDEVIEVIGVFSCLPAEERLAPGYFRGFEPD